MLALFSLSYVCIEIKISRSELFYIFALCSESPTTREFAMKMVQGCN